MGETVDALGYKADVPARAKDSIAERVDAVKSKITGVGTQVSEAAPDAGDAKHAAEQAVGVAQENPLGLALGAAALGFLAGALIPSTKIEDERLGPVADQVREQARRTGEEALEHGKQVAQDTLETAGEKAQEAIAEVRDEAQHTAQTHAHELSDSVKESAAEMQGAPTAPGSGAAPLGSGSVGQPRS